MDDLSNFVARFQDRLISETISAGFRNKSQTWRMRAKEMRRFAHNTRDAEPKAIMLRIADDYDRLANLAQEHEKGEPS
jgi:hypothetical protein